MLKLAMVWLGADIWLLVCPGEVFLGGGQVSQVSSVAAVGATIGCLDGVGPGFRSLVDDCRWCPGAIIVLHLNLLANSERG